MMPRERRSDLKFKTLFSSTIACAVIHVNEIQKKILALKTIKGLTRQYVSSKH